MNLVALLFAAKTLESASCVVAKLWLEVESSVSLSLSLPRSIGELVAGTAEALATSLAAEVEEAGGPR